MYFLLKMGIFHCYVSLPGGTSIFHRQKLLLAILRNLGVSSSLERKEYLGAVKIGAVKIYSGICQRVVFFWFAFGNLIVI